MQGRTKLSATIVFFGGFALQPPAQAQDDPIAPFRECGKIAETAQRLACFDGALARSDADAKAREARRERRLKEDFGLSATQMAERERERERSGTYQPVQSEAEPEQIESTISEVFTDGNGKKVFLLANGQVWRETAGSTYKGILRANWPARIKKARFGGFRLSINERTGFFSVQRLR